MTKEPEVIQDWIDKIEEDSDRLSVWELDFFQSIKTQFKRNGWVSNRQEEVLERIYAEKTR